MTWQMKRVSSETLAFWLDVMDGAPRAGVDGPARLHIDYFNEPGSWTAYVTKWRDGRCIQAVTCAVGTSFDEMARRVAWFPRLDDVRLLWTEAML